MATMLAELSSRLTFVATPEEQDQLSFRTDPTTGLAEIDMVSLFWNFAPATEEINWDVYGHALTTGGSEDFGRMVIGIIQDRNEHDRTPENPLAETDAA